MAGLDEISTAIGSLTSAVGSLDKRMDGVEKARSKRDGEMFERLGEIKTGVQANGFRLDGVEEDQDKLKTTVKAISEDYVSKKKMKGILAVVASLAGIIGVVANKFWGLFTSAPPP